MATMSRSTFEQFYHVDLDDSDDKFAIANALAERYDPGNKSPKEIFDKVFKTMVWNKYAGELVSTTYDENGNPIYTYSGDYVSLDEIMSGSLSQSTGLNIFEDRSDLISLMRAISMTADINVAGFGLINGKYILLPTEGYFYAGLKKTISYVQNDNKLGVYINLLPHRRNSYRGFYKIKIGGKWTKVDEVFLAFNQRSYTFQTIHHYHFPSLYRYEGASINAKTTIITERDIVTYDRHGY